MFITAGTQYKAVLSVCANKRTGSDRCEVVPGPTGAKYCPTLFRNMATHPATQPSILAVDCGTTGLKATLVGQDGRTLATAMHEYRNKTSSSAGGVVEQLPDDWWCDSREG